jgi:hypothetical protein
VSWDVCLCQLANSYGPFGVSHRLHLRNEEGQEIFFGLLNDHDNDDDDSDKEVVYEWAM